MQSECNSPPEPYVLGNRTSSSVVSQCTHEGNPLVRTSLTGIEETPISIAMNQHALSEGQRLLMRPRYDHMPEVATSP